jgi:excisionase family DNA binding protein
MTQSDTPVWLSRSEAAAHAGVDITTIDRWMKKGALGKYRSGRRVRVNQSELDQYLEPKEEADD